MQSQCVMGYMRRITTQPAIGASLYAAHEKIVHATDVELFFKTPLGSMKDIQERYKLVVHSE